MSATINIDRRRLLGAGALAVAALQVTRARAAATHSTFGPLKQIDAGVLSIGYAEAGPPTGVPVMLLHGWPYDI